MIWILRKEKTPAVTIDNSVTFTPQELEILREATRRFGSLPTFGVSLEEMFTSEEYMGIKTASSLQRAICRVIDGLPPGELTKDPSVKLAFGDTKALETLDAPPAEVALLSGIRTGKSLLAAAIAIKATQTCNVTHLGPGETPRVSVLSLTRDLAAVVQRHVVGHVISRPKLNELLVGEPTADTVTLRHPSGRPVEIKIVAGSRAGASLVARWCAGVIFDEAPRMIGASEGVVNLEDARNAVIGRLLPGAQMIHIGSPWQPSGPIYEMVQEYWGKPSRRLVVIKAPGPDLNPVWWTPWRCSALKKNDPDAYRTDVEAEFSDPEEALFNSTLIDQSVSNVAGDIPHKHGQEYIAAMDPATRGDAWTLAIATQNHDSTKQVVCVRQWQGSRVAPLSPAAVLSEIKEACQKYHIAQVHTDQWAGDALREIAARDGLYVIVEPWTTKNRTELFSRLRTEMQDGRITLPPDPIVRQDLQHVKRRVTQNGIMIALPRTSDARHCDYAPAIVRALSRWIGEPQEVAPEYDTDDYWKWKGQKLEEQEVAQWEQQQERQWWEQA